MLDRAKLESVKNTVVNSTKKTMQTIGSHVNELSQVDVAPYKVSATSSGMFALLYAITSLEGGTTSSYLAMACAAFEAGMALSQYNGNNANVLRVKSFGSATYNTAASTYNTFFPQAKQANPVPVESEVNDAPLRVRAK